MNKIIVITHCGMCPMSSQEGFSKRSCGAYHWEIIPEPIDEIPKWCPLENHKQQ